MKKITFLVLLNLFSYSSFSQQEKVKLQTYQIQVYFEFDSYSISPSYQQIIIKKIKTKLKNKNIKDITISGNTDYYGSNSYNLILSKKRNTTIENIIENCDLNNYHLKIEDNGEEKPKYNNKNQLGRKNNRRVDVIFTFTDSVFLIKEKKKEPEIKNLQFENDTIIYGKKGIQLIVKAKSFFPKKIKEVQWTINEYYFTSTIVANDLVTIDEERNRLVSGGMFEICPTEKLTGPIIVRIPIFDNCNSKFDLYNINDSGTWTKNSTLLKINKNFIVFELDPISVCTKLNFDCRAAGNYRCGCDCNKINADSIVAFFRQKDLYNEKENTIKPFVVKSRRTQYKKTYLADAKNISVRPGIIYKKRKALHEYPIKCDSSNILISIAARRKKTYLFVKHIEQVTYKNGWLFGKRFIIKRKEYEEINPEELEKELLKRIGK